MNDPDRRLLDILGHDFADPALLDQALTHRSLGACNNERLEFLGDSILNFIAADLLYHLNPDDHEGRLTRLRAHLVRRETLAAIARELDLGAALRLGPGELKSGGRDRDSILADAFEAVIGALYLDGGLGLCREFLTRVFDERIAQASHELGLKDAKTRLQESLQSRGLPLPVYRVIDVKGAAHDQNFTVECLVDGIDQPSRGVGSSRRRAEQEAARLALATIDHES
jgi:ribonuclease-3